MKLTLFVLSVCILSIATHSDGQVKDRLKSLEETKTVQPTHAGAYLGIAVEPLHPAFGMHLPKSLVAGQGIMIANVMKGSPAEKAGLRMHDILAAYDDQKLFAGDQLVKLVRADKPGRSVKLQIVREGQLETVTVVRTLPLAESL